MALLGAIQHFTRYSHIVLQSRSLLFTSEEIEAQRENSDLLRVSGSGTNSQSRTLLAPACCLSKTLHFLIFISLQIPETTRAALSEPI